MRCGRDIALRKGKKALESPIILGLPAPNRWLWKPFGWGLLAGAILAVFLIAWVILVE